MSKDPAQQRRRDGPSAGPNEPIGAAGRNKHRYRNVFTRVPPHRMRLPPPDLVVWNTVLSACASQGAYGAALRVFRALASDASAGRLASRR